MRDAAFWSNYQVVCEGVPPGQLVLSLEHVCDVLALLLVVVDDRDELLGVSLIVLKHTVDVELSESLRVSRSNITVVTLAAAQIF